jgi:hypothetical protein
MDALDEISKELAYRMALSVNAIIKNSNALIGFSCSFCDKAAGRENKNLLFCPSCWFRYSVMKSAGREDEFLTSERPRRSDRPRWASPPLVIHPFNDETNK